MRALCRILTIISTIRSGVNSVVYKPEREHTPVDGDVPEIVTRLRHFFLHANRWQMLLLFLAAGVVGQFVGPIAIIVTAPSSIDLGWPRIVAIGLLEAISEVVLLCWVWFVGSFLCSVVEPDVRPSQVLFRVAIICPLLFALGAFAFMINPKPYLPPLIVTLSLFVLVCLIYDFDFVTRNLILAETGQPRMPGEGAVTFLQVFFLPVGVWFIQPRINRLYSERGSKGQAG
jgi:hypothetical protein